MKNDLAHFSFELRKLVGDAQGVRPLLCRGDPFACQVALVGANPGTTTPFWPYWSDMVGMDKDGWLEAYQKQHGGRYGRSRAAIERFLPAINAPVIELNAHATQSARLAQLAASSRTVDVFTYIFTAVRPRVVICAGSDAKKAVAELRVDWPVRVLEAPHFIYWGRERERLLAAEVNAAL
jgi:hypothetical protein